MENKLTEYQKKIIFVSGVSVIFLGSVVFSLVFDPESRGTKFGETLTILATLFGLVSAFLTQEKAKRTKLIVLGIGLCLMLLAYWFFGIVDTGKLLGLYVGGYWAGYKWSKSETVAELLEETKREE